MKLLQAMAGETFGGVEEFFVKCAESFEEQGVIQRTFIRNNVSISARLRAANVETITLPFGRLFDWKSVPYLAAEIDRFRPDILLTWKKRATILSSQASKFAEHRVIKIGRLDGYSNVKSFKNCDQLIGVTPDIAKFAVDSGWPADRVHFLPNFAVNEPGNRISRGLLGIPDEDAPLLLAAGRLAPEKGFDILLRAMKPLEGVFLLLAGEGDERNHLMKQAQELGIASRVRFLGWREDISNLMATADIFVCSSRAESFGIIVVEAWMSRTPIIACSAKGPAWLIRNGVDGLLTPIDDAEALAKSILELINNPDRCRNLATFGRQRFEAEFSKSVITKRYLDLFRDLANCHT